MDEQPSFFDVSFEDESDVLFLSCEWKRITNFLLIQSTIIIIQLYFSHYMYDTFLLLTILLYQKSTGLITLLLFHFPTNRLHIESAKDTIHGMV